MARAMSVAHAVRNGIALLFVALLMRTDDDSLDLAEMEDLTTESDELDTEAAADIASLQSDNYDLGDDESAQELETEVTESMVLSRVTEECEGDEDCMCKELLITSICALKDEKDKAESMLEFDKDGDGSISEDEFGQSGLADERTERTFPISCDSVRDEIVKMAVEHGKEALKDCKQDREIFKKLPGQLQNYTEQCDAVHTMEEPEGEGETVEADSAEEGETVEDDLAEKGGEGALAERDGGSMELGAFLMHLSAKDHRLIRHDVDLSKVGLDDGINSYLNFSTLRAAKLPKSLVYANREVAFASVAKGFSALLTADFCWQDVWARPTTHLRCKSGWYQSGLFCYRHCKSGYKRFGDHCWGSCPGGYADLGAWCQKAWWIGTRSAKKHIYHEPGCGIGSSRCAGCPSGYYMAGLRCYKNCKSGYYCSSDAALTGTLKCHSYLAHSCAAGCAMDSASCFRNTFEIIQGLLDAAVSTAILVVTFGASAGAKVSATTAKQMAGKSLKNAAKLKLKTAGQTFRRALQQTTRKKVQDEMISNMQNKVQEKITHLAIAHALSESESLEKEYFKKFEKGQTAFAEAVKIAKTIDPTGIVTAIEGSTGDTVADPNVQAANWLTVLSFVDPTGILGAVAGIVKHSHCESTLAKMRKELDGPVKAPGFSKMPIIR